MVPPANRKEAGHADHCESFDPDYRTIQARRQATSAAGDFGRIGVRLQIVGERPRCADRVGDYLEVLNRRA